MTPEDNDGELRHALVAGGGTGGHVFPGIALAAELGRRGWKVSFAGRSGGLEERLAVGEELPFFGLEAAPLVGESTSSKVSTLITALKASSTARRLVVDNEIDIAVGLGGYVSVPALIGARRARRPIMLFEPNATVGLANRWLSRLAGEAAVAYEAAADSLHCTTTVTGTPVRRRFFEQPVEPREPPLLLVLGGSQGALQLNEIVAPALASLGDAARQLDVVHQCGAAHIEATESAYRDSTPRLRRLEVVPFLDDVATALGRASLVISRAGAITLAEICAVGRASILVPLALAAAHQTENAQALVEAGAARMLAATCGADELSKTLRTLISAPESLPTMAAAARRLSRPDAVERLADRVEAQGGAN